MKTSNDDFWFDNIKILFQYDKLDKFLPSIEMSYKQKINSFVRLGIYTGLILTILNKNYLYLYIPIGIMSFTYILYLLNKINVNSMKNIENIKNIDTKINNDKSDDDKRTNDKSDDDTENFINTELNNINPTGNCNIPVNSTKNNPFMNPSPFAPRDISSPISTFHPHVKSEIETNFNTNLFKDANDIFNHSNGFRQFYTVPGNTFPNNRDTFMKWCYKRPKTCKEGNGSQCYKNVHSDLTANSFDSRNI